MAEYRNQKMALSCTTKRNILKITGKRLIDGTIIYSVDGQQLSGPRKEFENDLVKIVVRLEEIMFVDFKLSPCFESIMYSFGCFPGV